MHISSGRSVIQGALLLFVLFNGTITNKSSTNGKEIPAVNCKGTLTEKDCGDVYKVENITIGGLYKQIRVFVAPSCFTSPMLDKDITKHYAYLDLDQLAKLETGNVVTYNKKSYITLHVFDKTQSKTEYFIETSKMVEYTVTESSESDRRKISIEKVQAITFGICAEPVKKQETQPQTSER